jgi:hypothetical protein
VGQLEATAIDNDLEFTSRLDRLRAQHGTLSTRRFIPRSIAVRFVLFLVVSLLTAPAFSSQSAAREDELFAGLMSWAVRLSSYPAPDKLPTVEFVPQAFFDDQACHGKHCHVWGWYPNTGQDVVYVHEELRPLLADDSNPRSLLAASVVVHEFAHYLQAASRGFAPYSCEQALELEREAYKLQSAYIVSYGRYLPVGVSMHGANCAGSANDEVTDTPTP